MALITVSIDLPEELWEQVQQSASHHSVDVNDVVYTAVQEFFELSNDDRLAIAEGIRQADAGELIDHEEVVAWFEDQKNRGTKAA